MSGGVEGVPTGFQLASIPILGSFCLGKAFFCAKFIFKPLTITDVDDKTLDVV